MPSPRRVEATTDLVAGKITRETRSSFVAWSVSIAAAWLCAAPASVADPAYFDTWRGFTTGSVDDAMFPSDGVTADFDGDGIVDLAVVYYWQRPKLTILLGDGDGAFGEPTHYPAEVAHFVASGDFDHDGDPDLVVSNYGDAAQLDTVSFYFNEGDGTFGAPMDVFVGRKPLQMAPADFDGDGDLDLAVGAIGTTSNPILDVTILYNDGTGAFPQSESFLGGDQDAYYWPLRPWSLTAGDLNGDGLPDLAVGHAYQHCSVLLNDGSGGFGPPATHFVDSGPAGIDDASGITLVDADHDGDLDVMFSCIYMRVYVTGDPGAVALFRNQGDGTLGEPEVIALMAYSTGAEDLVAADVTGDGWDDIVMAWEGGGELGWGVLEADGAGGFGVTTRYTGGDSPTAVCPVDMDGDDDLDVVVPSRGSMSASVHLNPGNGDFSPQPVFPVNGFDYRHFDAGDLDNDGDLDLAVCGGGLGFDGWIQVMRNQGDGTYGGSEWFDLPNTARRIKIRDLDGDGWNDLVWADDPDGPPYDFKTMMNDGDGTLGPYRNWTVGTCGTRELATIDIDDDGDLDVLLGEYLSCFGLLEKHIYIRKNLGDGTFSPAYALVGDGQGASGITGGDFNEDGKVDLAVTNPNGVIIYPGNGDGTYGAHTTIPMEGGKIEIRTARFNQDAHDDLVVQGTAMRVLLGRGDGTFEPADVYEVTPGATTALEIGDADGDGDVDVLIGNYYAHDASVFMNRGDGTFAPVRYGAAGKVLDVLLADLTGDGVRDLGFFTTGDHFPFGVVGAQVIPGTGFAPVGVDVPGRPTLPVLGPAIPNPFAGATAFSYVLRRPGTVRLAVYDVEGRTIRTLVDGPQAVGEHQVTWDARDSRGKPVASGVYFARLDSDTGRLVRRIVRVP